MYQYRDISFTIENKNDELPINYNFESVLLFFYF